MDDDGGMPRTPKALLPLYLLGLLAMGSNRVSPIPKSSQTKFYYLPYDFALKTRIFKSFWGNSLTFGTEGTLVNGG